jgi:hypothetical protein
MSNYVKSRTTPVQSAISSVNTTVDNIARNPVPVVEVIVLTAALGPAGLGLSTAAAAPVAAAATTYINGGSTEDAAKAAAISYGSYQVAEAYAPGAQKPDNIDVGGGFNPATGAGDPVTAAGAAGVPTATEKAGVKGATSGALKAIDKKGSASDIVAGGIVGGASSYGGAAASEAAGFEPGSVESGLTQTIVGQSIGNYLSPTRSAQTVGGGATPSPTTSVATTGAGQAPGSQALSQALRIGDPGAPIFGGDKEEGKKSGWNVESLRYMGQES